MSGPGTISELYPIEHGTDRIALSAAGKASRISVIVVAVMLLFFSVYLVAAGVQELGRDGAEFLFNLASNPFVALLVGLLVTAAVQSSSTTTALTVAAVATGAIGLPTAIPIILGANIGTTITPLIVSFSYAHDKEAFRRAFATASLHMWFNTLFVLAFFPIEASFGVVRRILPEITIPGETVKLPFFVNLVSTVPISGVWAVLTGAVLLLVSIRLIDNQLRHLLTPLTWRVLGRTSSTSAVAGFGAGLGLTVLIQASSATISATLPFATAKLADARGYLSVILGANVGTTLLAVLTAYATPGEFHTHAFQAAMVHVAFNVVGVLAITLIKPLRRLLYRLAKFNGQIAQRSVWLAFGCAVGFYFAIPALVITAFSLVS